MRFVLYFFTWTFVLSTLGYLLEGDFQNFGTGLFLSALMLWWSKSVRDRRRRKLGILPKNSGNKKSRLTRAVKAASEEWSGNSAPVVTANPITSEEAPATSPFAETVSEPGPHPAGEDIPSQTSEPVNVAEAAEESPVEAEVKPEVLEHQPESPEPSSGSDATVLAVDVKAIEREFWKDSKGNDLNVGSQVSFLANSRGESVSIAGVLLGERDGKALIEVQKGALLPANEYAIPWNVVSLRS
jgi:hypothetical protein